MKMIWGLCLLCLALGLRAVHAGPVRKSGKMEEKEEINMLMFGVIQFSESLNYAYETTEAKIAKISKTLKSHEETLQNLGKQTEQAAEVEKQIKEVIQLLQAQMVEQQTKTKMMKDWLASTEQEEVELRAKVQRLEMYLNNFAPTSIIELKERAEEHSDVLRGLQHLIQYQKENIDAQSEQLSKLQNMSEAMT